MPYQSVTRATLRQRLTERYEGVPFWTADSANRAINEGLRIWNLLTGTWKARTSVPCVPSDPWVPLPGSITFGFRVDWQSRPLIPTTIASLDSGHPTWQGETIASGGGVPTRPILWAPAGLNLIAIWPAVTQPAVLVVDGIITTPVLSADGDYVNLGEEDLSTLLDYALHVLSFREGGARFQATLPAYTRFLTAATERNGKLAEARFFRGALGIDERPRGARPVSQEAPDGQ